MGNNKSKTKEENVQGDAKYMYSRNLDSAGYLPKWKKQYDFNRKLGTQACHEFKNQTVEDLKGEECYRRMDTNVL